MWRDLYAPCLVTMMPQHCASEPAQRLAASRSPPLSTVGRYVELVTLGLGLADILSLTAIARQA